MWKKKIHRTVLLMGCMAFAAGSRAQEIIALPALIDMALAENYGIKIQRNEAQVAANNNTAGHAGFLPRIDLQAEGSSASANTRQALFNGEVREGDNAQSFLNAMVQMNWTVFDGFRMFARRDELGLLEQVGDLELKYFIEQTIADMTIAYYQLIRERERLENYRQALEVSRFRHTLEKKKREVGSGDALQYNQALVDFNTDSAFVLEQQRIIKSLEIQINRIVNRELDAPLPTEGQVPGASMPGERSALLAKALEANKDVKRALLEEMIAETHVRIRQADRYPQVDVFGQYAYSNQTSEIGFAQSNRNIGPRYGVTVRFNLFNGGNVQREVRNAQVARENTALVKADVSRLTEEAVLDRYYRYQAFAVQLSLAEANDAAAEKSLAIARAQLQQGAINGYDFRLTQLSVIGARQAAVELRFALKALEVELNRISGELVKAYL